MAKKWMSPPIVAARVEESADKANMETFPMGTSTTLSSCIDEPLPPSLADSMTTLVLATQKPNNKGKGNN